MAAYSLPVTNLAPAANTPQIAEYGRTANDGEVIPLTGESLQTNFLAADGITNSLFVSDYLSGQECVVEIPASLASDTMYVLWPTNSSGLGAPVAINKTEAWWASYSVTTSGTYTVYGQNLNLSGNTYLYIDELDRWLTNSAGNAYKADFTIPSDFTNGTYTAYAHNGIGRKYGWAKAMTLQVDAVHVWSGAQVNVETHGADGSDADTDHTEIQAAISACPVNGTVYLPAGTYYLGGQIGTLGSNKRILGAGKDVTIIKPHSSIALNDNEEGLFDGYVNNVEFSDLTIHDDSSDLHVPFYLKAGTTEKFTLRNVKISQIGATYEHATETEGLFNSDSVNKILFVGCDFYPKSGIRLVNTENSIVKDCNFYGIQDVTRMIEITPGREVAVTGCLAQNYDMSDYTDEAGWGEGRWLYSGNPGAFRNCYFGENTTTNLQVRWNWDNPPYPRDNINQKENMNTGEHIMFEGRGVNYLLTATASTSNTVSATSYLPWSASYIYPSSALTIIEGTGFGQIRSIADVNRTTGLITIDEPWLVEPDTSTVFVTGKLDYRVAVHGNRLDGTQQCYLPGVTNYQPNFYIDTASCGVSFYGGHGMCVMANNVMTEVKQGGLNWTLSSDKVLSSTYGTDLVAQPTYFNYSTGNTTDGAQDAYGDWALHTTNLNDKIPSMAMYGNNWNGNTSTNIVDDEFSWGGANPLLTNSLSIWDGVIQ